jgi:hypothetical protein
MQYWHCGYAKPFIFEQRYLTILDSYGFIRTSENKYPTLFLSRSRGLLAPWENPDPRGRPQGSVFVSTFKKLRLESLLLLEIFTRNVCLRTVEEVHVEDIQQLKNYGCLRPFHRNDFNSTDIGKISIVLTSCLLIGDWSF